MDIRRPTTEEYRALRCAFGERANLDPKLRTEFALPEPATSTVLGAVAWSLMVLYQDRPVIIWLAALAFCYQIMVAVKAVLAFF